MVPTSMRSLCFILLARAVHTFVLRAASTLESTTAKQQYFANFLLTAILFEFFSRSFHYLLLLHKRNEISFVPPVQFTCTLKEYIYIQSTDKQLFHLTLMMTSAQVVETSVTATDNSPFKDCSHTDDHTTRSVFISVQKNLERTIYEISSHRESEHARNCESFVTTSKRATS